MNTWLKDNGPVIGAFAGALFALAAVLQLVVVGPMNRGFDGLDQRLGGLEIDVSELRTLSDRVSRNEGQIDFLMERLQTVDAPSP